MTAETTPPGMLLYGLAAIAGHLGIRKRQAQHLMETGQIPTFNMGRVVCANRATLTAAIRAAEARSAHKPKADATPV